MVVSQFYLCSMTIVIHHEQHKLEMSMKSVDWTERDKAHPMIGGVEEEMHEEDFQINGVTEEEKDYRLGTETGI